MINVVLLAILMFFLSFFPILRWVEKNIDSLRSFGEGRKKMAKPSTQSIGKGCASEESLEV